MLITTVSPKSKDPKIARALRLAPSLFPSSFVAPQALGPQPSPTYRRPQPSPPHSLARASCPMALSPTTTYKIGAPLSLCSSYSCPRSHWALVSVFHLFHPAPCAHVVREGLPYGPCPQRSQITKVISFRSLQEAVIRHHRCRSYAMGETLFTIISITIRARVGGWVP